MMMVVQLGLAMIPEASKDNERSKGTSVNTPLCLSAASGLTSGTTNGTVGSMRNADELSTTMHLWGGEITTIDKGSTHGIWQFDGSIPGLHGQRGELLRLRAASTTDMGGEWDL